MTSTAHALITELDAAISSATSARQANILQAVTDLFLDSAMSFSDEQVAVFDDVIRRLMGKADNAMLIILSARLASIGNPPAHVIISLAQDDDIAISGPILRSSAALPDQTVVDIASVKGPKHLAAIASRLRINEIITDILVDRGTPDVSYKIVANPEARLSEMGFVKLINRAKTDKTLATAIAGRNDLPEELVPFLKLVLGQP
jgi:uncharacterized protein (DUF2336 family)